MAVSMEELSQVFAAGMLEISKRAVLALFHSFFTPLSSTGGGFLLLLQRDRGLLLVVGNSATALAAPHETGVCAAAVPATH